MPLSERLAGILAALGLAAALAMIFAPRPDSRRPRAALELREARSIHLERAVEFRRERQRFAAHDAVLFRVNGADPFGYMMDREAPRFVYGRGECLDLTSPPFDGEAIVLCPLLGVGEPATLWQTFMGSPREWELARAKETGRSVRVEPPPRSAFKDLEDVRDQVLAGSRARATAR